jgi:endogenous inhibitor of DNA gyrase (YacG/DUF329 family)
MTTAITNEYIAAHRTKSVARGVKVECPSCGGKDLWITAENGRGFCFECCSAYTIAGSDEEAHESKQNIVYDIPAIRQVYANAKSAYQDRLSPDHRLYLHDRGIDDTAIDAFGIGFCDDTILPEYRSAYARDGGIANYEGKPFLEGRIVFPYIAEGKITDLRGRDVVGADPKYKSPFRSSGSRGAIYPFNFDRAFARSAETKMVIVTEGEIKAILADLHGFAAVAFPGMASWRPAMMFDADVQYVVVYDNAKGVDRWRIDKALSYIQKKLPTFSVVTLPLLGEEKNGY